VRWAEVAVALLVLAAIIAAFVSFLRRPARSALAIVEKSIAVLPFENRSEDKANAYFADGIQDEILTRLSKIADLKVISRTSTQHYKSAPENLPEIAKQLGVAHILEGSVQKSGDAVRVNVQLIKATNDSHLWADTFDRKLTDIFSVESEVAKAIAEQLRAKLTGQEEQIITAKPTENPEAYDAYLRGLAYSLKGVNTANLLAAQKYLREAVRLDPKFALAWARLSYVEARGYLTQALQPTVALREEARQAAETALGLQPNLGEAIMAKGYYHYACLKDYDTAVRYLSKHVSSCPIAARFLNRWRMSRGGEASGTRARVTSTKPSGSIPATSTYSSSTRFPIWLFVVSPKRCESLIRFSISRQTTWIRSRRRRLSHKPRATFHALLRYSLRSDRPPTSTRLWRHKFIKQSWNASLHKSSLGSRKYWPSLIQP
jgi:TolB-like protein